MLDKREKTDGDKTYKIWIIGTLTLVLALLTVFASITIYIDPFFHFHAPLNNYEYPLKNERYQNDGISRNFKYNGIITGSSMTQNFMTSEADEIFGADFIKVPFSGGYYKEVNDNLKRAYDSGKDIKYVIRCIDYSRLVYDKDYYREDIDYPTYLYNNNPLDDVEYVLNKTIFIDQTWNVIEYTKSGNKTTSFDDYTNWNDLYTFGVESVLNSYTLDAPEETFREMTDEERTMISDNIRQNVTDIADEHPETTFYIFFPPYSICYWDVLKNSGEIDWHIDTEQVAIEEILKHSNIKLYSFCNNFELIGDLNNYKDRAHFGEWVNSDILEWMYDEEYLLTEYNYMNYIETIREFYNTYDYSMLRK